MSPVDIDPRTAIYTNPQGKKPLKKPIENSALFDFFFKYSPNLVFTLPMTWYRGFVKLNLFKTLAGIKTNIIMVMPTKIDNRC